MAGALRRQSDRRTDLTGQGAVFGLLAVLAAVVASLALGGCGHTQAAHDPFVGTWHAGSPQIAPYLVIAKVGVRFQATLVFYQGDPKARVILTRHGNRLTGPIPPRINGTSLMMTGRQYVVLTYGPTTGHLTFRSTDPAGHLGAAALFSRLSPSTAMPTPSP